MMGGSLPPLPLLPSMFPGVAAAAAWPILQWRQRPEPNSWSRDEQTPPAHRSATLPKFVVNKGACSGRGLSGHLGLRLPHRSSPFLGSHPSPRRDMASPAGHQQKGRGQRQEDRSWATLPSCCLPPNTGCFLLLGNKFGSGQRSHHQHHRQTGAPSAAWKANSQMVK